MEREEAVRCTHAFGNIAYAMGPDERQGKLDVKGIKCNLCGYCEGIKAHRLMFMETK